MLGSFSTGQILSVTIPPLALPARLRRGLLVAALIAAGLAIAWLPLKETALLLAGAIFITGLLLRPVISLYLLIPLIPFSPWFAVPAGGVNIGLMELVLAGGLVAWLLQLAAGRQTLARLRSPAPPLLWPFLVFLGGVGLSWLNALSIGASLVETIKWVEMLLLYLLAIALLPVNRLKWATAILLLTGMAQAALGLYQFIFKVGPEGFLLFGGRFLRAYGTFAQPNPYAGYLGLVLPLSLALLLWQAGRWAGPHKPRRFTPALLLAGIPFGLLLAALVATLSRGAWMGFAAAAVVVLAVHSKRTMAMLAGLVLAATLVALPGTFTLETAASNAPYAGVIRRVVDAAAIFTITDITTLEVNDANFATIERLAHWQAARNMWRDNPWLGVGFGNYAAIYPAYAIGRWLDPLGHAHNYLLNLGAESGLTGIIAYLIFWIAAFGVTWQTIRRSRGFYRAVAVGGLGIIVHLHVHNLFDNLYVQGMYLHIAIILAVISIIYQHHRAVR